MLDAAVRDGSADRSCVFEVFARRLPEGRRYGVVAGTGRLLDLIEDFVFPAEDLSWLLDQGVIGERTAAYLASYRFSGDVDGYAEGELFFPYSPILTVRGGFADAVVLETLVLSVLNHDSAVAGAAARFVTAAGKRPIIEMGSRRTHEIAAVAAARAAYLAGFHRDLEPGRRSPVRHPDHRHGRARVHLAARRRADRVHQPDRIARPGHDAARRHLRHHPRHRVGRESRRAGARRHPHRLGRPGRARPPGPGPARRPRLPEHPHRRQRRPRRALDRVAWPSLPSTPTAPAPRSSSARVRRPPGWSTNWSRSTAVRWPSARPTRRPKVDARPRGGATDAPVRRPTRSSAPTRITGSRTATVRSNVRSCATDSAVADLPTLADSRAHLAEAIVSLPWEGLRLSRGEPAIPTVHRD